MLFLEFFLGFPAQFNTLKAKKLTQAFISAKLLWKLRVKIPVFPIL